jgi:hypothetical protein
VIVYPNQALEARFIDRHIRIAWTGRDYDKGDQPYDPYGPGDFLDHTASVTAQQRRPLRRIPPVVEVAIRGGRPLIARNSAPVLLADLIDDAHG